jgi:signal transduction histidine kinase
MGPLAYHPDQGLLGQEFYCLLEDDHGNLWSGGSRGIFFVSKAELNDFFDGKRPSVGCQAFGKADGLKSVDCTLGFPQGCRSPDGRLWFATTYGLAVIDPNHLQFNSVPPPVQIEKVIVDLTHVFAIGAGSQHVELGPGAHHLEFDYAGLSFSAPEKVRFKYRLEGFDKDWIDAGTRREAYYTNLAPGTYQFRLVACNNDGLWIPEGAAAVTTLMVRPHFYQTLWFYGLCGGAVILALWLLWRWRLQQILEERTRLARELHDTVARGSVALIWQIEGAKGIAESTRSEPLLASLDKAAKLARENLKETRRAMRAMRSGVLAADRSLPSVLQAVLAGTAEGTQLHPKLKISGIPYRVEPAWEQALVRIAQESLTNTLKYAQAQRFEAELSYSLNELRLRLRDDGIGFDYKPGGQSVRNGASAQTCAISDGLGLLGIEERCRQLGAKMQVESSRENGTAIEVVVPRRPPIWDWLMSLVRWRRPSGAG